MRSCLERIERTTSDLIVQREEGSSLDIAIGATFATQWLIPKLKDFRSKYSKININLTVKSDPFVLNNSQFDAVIYYGDDVWRDTAGELLLREGKVVPICSRELINDIPDVSAEIIAQFPLLHLSSREDAWKQWFATAGLADDLRPLRGSRFELFTMLTSAAMSGLGVALVPEIFVLTELANNQLVIPVSHHLPNDQGYYISYNDDPINKEALEVFGYWLRGRCNEAA
ncbi:MAG: LysR family transcriptional regulator [Candidimonas sp.]|nr:MAG: LysR family transcriptional regulator [Candidimonas sp.]TAM19564.1 MAG: LysR family transcriptional regulator [Candidimonas sp.]